MKHLETVTNQLETESHPDYKTTTLPSDQIITDALVLLKHRMVEKGFQATSPDNVKDYLTLKIAELEREEFHGLFLDNQHCLIEDVTLSTGTIDSAAIYPREVVKTALKLNAAAVIFAHNHPSGLAAPSEADKAITEKLKTCLTLFDIRVLDHIIVAGVKTYSFADNGSI